MGDTVVNKPATRQQQNKIKEEEAEPVVRKLRVFCEDPDATDSSSDEADDGAAPRRVRKFFVMEARLDVQPVVSSSSKPPTAKAAAAATSRSKNVSSPVSVLPTMPGEATTAVASPVVPLAGDSQKKQPSSSGDLSPFSSADAFLFGEPAERSVFAQSFDDVFNAPLIDYVSDYSAPLDDLGDLPMWPGVDGGRFSDIGDDLFAGDAPLPPM
ncbi:hypothetical protein EJB05_50942, partial [Eragrostis curvula]